MDDRVSWGRLGGPACFADQISCRWLTNRCRGARSLGFGARKGVPTPCTHEEIYTQDHGTLPIGIADSIDNDERTELRGKATLKIPSIGACRRLAEARR